MARRREVSRKIKKIAKEVGQVVSELFSESTPVDETDEDEDEDEGDEGEEEEQATCVLQFGLDPVVVDVEKPPQTIRRAFSDHQYELNYNPERPVTFKVNGELIDGNEVVLPGELYVANVTGEKKGC